MKHRLVLRVFDKVCKVIFKHEPQNRSHHNKAMYCMMSDGHIYTLNHDIKRLEQQQDESDTYTPKVGETYYINEEAKPRQAKMIANVDDILQVLREMPKPETKKGEKERKVLELRFGLADGTPRTLEEVGSQFAVTRERIRQIEAKALRKMRHPTRIRQLNDYIEARKAPE